MTQIIEIEGDLVRVVDRSIVTQAPLSEVMPLIERKIPVRSLVPRSAIWVTLDQNGTSHRQGFLCEIPPGIKVITKSGRKFRLAMPWTYMWLVMETAGDTTNPLNWSLTDYRCYHTNQQVVDLQSRLWTAFLPNVYEDARICFGSTGADAAQPVHTRIDSIVNTWYISQFNNDVHGGRNHPLPFNASLPNGWREWVLQTREWGAMAWTKFPEWAITNNDNGVTSFTVSEVINSGHLGRMAPITVVDAIPELPMPATFGRSEEWLRGLTRLQRSRLHRALQNMIEDDPGAAIEDTQPAPDLSDDGGEAA